MTYLFDAKYRIEGRVNGVDTPPEDAINQMHRYRDAIYYKEHATNELKKEVIGGYILFPGDGQKADVEVSKFYKTIDEVNIGAFPLRPKDVENRDLLIQFIKSLITKNSTEILDGSIPQKGLYYVEDEPLDSCVLIQKIDDNVDYYDDLINGNTDHSTFDITGSSLNIQSLRYYVPVSTDYIIKGVYKIKSAIFTNLSDGKFCIELELSEFLLFKDIIPYPLLRVNPKGFECKTKREFDDLLRRHLY